MKRAEGQWHVVPLDSKSHDRSAFGCGASELDRYIREHASQDVKRDVARVFVVAARGSSEVVGYYSLSAASFKKDDLPPGQAKRLPHYPVPAVLLGRLAVDSRLRGQGLGAWLLVDALNRVALASQTIAVHAVIVDALDDAAASFYQKYGFIQFHEERRRLFLPMATVRQLVMG
jgi:GNAT superfamily N-acetyltransferase